MFALKQHHVQPINQSWISYSPCPVIFTKEGGRKCVTSEMTLDVVGEIQSDPPKLPGEVLS